MAQEPVDVVTGAFSYSGSAIARELGKAGVRVRTLTAGSTSTNWTCTTGRPPPRAQRHPFALAMSRSRAGSRRGDDA